ncbi:IclR family transcriptional regulator [Paraburkholderia unamae]|uniref:IclR family transcriptional regulator n=1 Tax=Paraburkholderia unamae TaxID=219649 RepID=A0ABX5KE40_9BURK|nr:helix-turn-helix domain-containing protein [Paraburkholderia unamae]PVX75718.1 IclR family transcriptional regulator [Paraburkholderia unamae]RAR57921.1 IclR family transcriptional regulator [Paraburkholderia unamae]CAG9259694.1 Transcriptional regulator, IclR family [Paraburkholderia unamae]
MTQETATPPKDAEGVAAVDRALAIVAAVEGAAAPVSLSELSRLTGLYKSTILRLVASLEKGALVVQRPDLKYELGPLAFRLGRAYDASHPLRERVLETLDRLVGQGTESASFHVRYDEEQRLCLFRVDSRHSTLDNVNAGDLLPLGRGAPAKVINYYFGRACASLPKDTPLVFTSFGERNPSCAAVSCPVFGSGDQFVGALSLSGPLERYSEEAIAHMTPLLLAAGRALSERLGGRWPAA